MPGLGITGLLTRCEWLEAVLTMLSQLPELQPAIPSSFLGISQAATASGTGGNIPAEAEERRGVKLRDPPGRCKHGGSAGGRTGRL